MTVAADLRTYLLADATVSGLLGTRVYPDKLAQGATLPAAIYYVISRGHALGLEGVESAGTCRVQVDVYATTRVEADQVTAAIVDRLIALSASAPATIGAGTLVCDLSIEGPRDDRLQPADGSDAWTYISSVDALLTIG